MKRGQRNLSKKGLNGLVREGVGQDRFWIYDGKKFKNLREVIGYKILQDIRNQSEKEKVNPWQNKENVVELYCKLRN